MNKFSLAAVLTIIAFCVLPIACDSSEQDTSNNEGKNEENTNSDSLRSSRVATDGSTDPIGQSISFGKGYGKIRFGMTYDQLIAAIGEPERRHGTACEYLSRGFAVLFNRGHEIAAIMCGDVSSSHLASIERFKGVTSEGVRMGSTLETVLQAYGKPTEKNTVPGDPSTTTLRRSPLTRV